MDVQRNSHTSLAAIPANRRLVDECAGRGMISVEAREFGLALLYPARNWGLWASRLLLALGVTLVLSGVVYFFAFNWATIAPSIKLGGVQAVILACVAVVYRHGVQQLFGQVMLLAASVLVGVFLAVFGQIYQTGADAYTLFMMWALLTLPWVLLGRFAALWAVWLVIGNIFLLLYWQQSVLPTPKEEMMIFPLMMLFNGAFLGLREYCAVRRADWLKGQWVRVVLVITILGYGLVPAIALIIELGNATYSMVFGALVAAGVHVIFYRIYRYTVPDMWALAATVLSGCIILEASVFQILDELLGYDSALMYLGMGGITLGLFSWAIIMLRAVARGDEGAHG